MTTTDPALGLDVRPATTPIGAEIHFWDNRATTHLAAVDMAHSDHERRLHHITLTGDVPVGPTGFRSEVLVGEPSGAVAAAAGAGRGADR